MRTDPAEGAVRSMRVLTVTHYMPPHLGGIEMVADALVRGLAARGHDTRWVASAAPARAGWEGARLRVPAWNALESKAGVPYPLWAARGLRDLDRQVTLADVVHVHDCLYMGSAAAVASARRLGKPVLLTQHIGMVPYGPVLDRVERLAYATLGRAVLAGADKLVACAPHVPAFFAELGVTRPFQLIRNGIDAARFAGATPPGRAALRARYDLSPTARVVLFSGRLVAKKGVDKVAALQRALAAEGVDLLVAGDGPLAHLLEGVPRTRRLGALPPDVMPELYALADLMVLPSHGEGLPLGVQEAMLSGAGVVVSDDPAFRDGLAGMPGARFARDAAELLVAARLALAEPTPREVVREAAAARWGLEPFLDAYEQALASLVR